MRAVDRRWPGGRHPANSGMLRARSRRSVAPGRSAGTHSCREQCDDRESDRGERHSRRADRQHREVDGEQPEHLDPRGHSVLRGWTSSHRMLMRPGGRRRSPCPGPRGAPKRRGTGMPSRPASSRPLTQKPFRIAHVATAPTAIASTTRKPQLGPAKAPRPPVYLAAAGRPIAMRARDREGTATGTAQHQGDEVLARSVRDSRDGSDSPHESQTERADTPFAAPSTSAHDAAGGCRLADESSARIPPPGCGARQLSPAGRPAAARRRCRWRGSSRRRAPRHRPAGPGP